MMRRPLLWMGAVLLGSLLPFTSCGASLPDPALDLHLSAPIRTWDEAIPLGNGTMGLLLWGEGGPGGCRGRGLTWAASRTRKSAAKQESVREEPFRQLLPSSHWDRFA